MSGDGSVREWVTSDGRRCEPPSRGEPTLTRRAGSARRLERRRGRAGRRRRRRARRAPRPAPLHDPPARQPADDRGRRGAASPRRGPSSTSSSSWSRAATTSAPARSTPCSARSTRPRTSATSSRTSSGATAARRSRRRRSTRSATSTRSAAHTVTFAIGPAGTGKTYLAMALAVAALSDREVGRIILTRPAVEAGERLGFLPGRHAREGRPLPAPALRRALRHARRRTAGRATWRRARSRSRRSRSCAAAR